MSNYVGFSDPDEPITWCRACEGYNITPGEVVEQRREHGEEAVLLCGTCENIDVTARRFCGLKIKRRNAFLSGFTEKQEGAVLRFFADAFPQFRVTLRQNPARLCFEKYDVAEAVGGFVKSALKT